MASGGFAPSVEACRGAYYRTAAESEVGSDLGNDIAGTKLREAKAKYKEALKVIARRDAMIEHLTRVAGNNMVDIGKARILSTTKGDEATAITVCTDIHGGQKIDRPDNYYDDGVTVTRMRNYFKNALRLIDLERKLVTINNLVVAVLGDLVSGDIHDELLESNCLSVDDALELVEDELCNGIKFLVREGGFKNITCVMKPGNHDRETQRLRISTFHKHSFAVIAYRHIIKRLATDSTTKGKVKFVDDFTYQTTLPIYGLPVRFHHGHMIRGGGGIGGITAPVLRTLAKWKPVGFDVFGHFHQFLDHTKFVMCNCICGHDTYAEDVVKAQWSPPSQTVIMVDKNLQRKTLSREVWVE